MYSRARPYHSSPDYLRHIPILFHFLFSGMTDRQLTHTQQQALSLSLSLLNSPTEVSAILVESQEQRCNGADSHDSPSRHNDLLIGESRPGIPDQMSNAVDAVIRERNSVEQLDSDFRGHAQSREPGCNTGAFPVQSDVGRDEVSESEDVECSRHDQARDAVECGSIPCDLWSIDGQMRSNGSQAALGSEDVETFGRGDDLCLGS